MYDSVYEAGPSGGSSGGVTSLIAGLGVALDPSTGLGDVTINVTGESFTVTASEFLQAGDLINMWNNSGPAAARKADNTTTTRPAVGYSLYPCASGDTATICFEGIIYYLSGLVPGLTYYLGVAGGLSLTPPVTPGFGAQQVGYAIDSTSLVFQPHAMTTV